MKPKLAAEIRTILLESFREVEADPRKGELKARIFTKLVEAGHQDIAEMFMTYAAVVAARHPPEVEKLLASLGGQQVHIPAASAAKQESTNQTRVPIIVAVIGVIGVLGAAVIANADKIWPTAKPVVLPALGSEPAEQKLPFAIQSEEPNFAVLGTLSGVASIARPFLKLSVDASVLRTHRGGGATVDYIRLGIAHSVNNTFDVYAWSEKHVVAQKIDGGSTITVPAFSTLIPMDSVDDLKSCWLVEEVGVRPGITTYAHSKRDIFEQFPSLR